MVVQLVTRRDGGAEGSVGVLAKYLMEWHPKRNDTLESRYVNCGSEKNVWWILPKGHEWETLNNPRHNNKGRIG